MKKVLVILVLVFLGGGYWLIRGRQINEPESKGMSLTPSSKRLSQQFCQDDKGNKLSYEEALEIANHSACNMMDTVFTENYLCNEGTSTFWVDLEVKPKKSGCNPACVVDLKTKTAEINWRCMGLVVPKE